MAKRMQTLGVSMGIVFVFVMGALFVPSMGVSAWTAGNPSYDHDGTTYPNGIYSIGNTGGETITIRAVFVPSEGRGGIDHDTFTFKDPSGVVKLGPIIMHATTIFTYTLQPTDTAGTWNGYVGWWSFDDASGRYTYHNVPNPCYVQAKTADYDGDGMSNGWELQYSFNPYSAADATQDADYDGFTNLWEYQHGTNPRGQAHWAIVVCGGSANWGSDPAQTDFNNEANEVVNILLGSGRYNTDTVQYLNPSVQPNRDAATTVGNVGLAFSSWLAARSDADDIVTIYFIDHGDSPAGHNFVAPDGTISATNVAGWINARSFYRLTFVIEACFAGTVWTGSAIAGTGRIVIASSASTESSWGVGGWPIFGHRFWGTDLSGGGQSIEGAFSDANAYTIDATTNHPPMVPQHPVMNDQIAGTWTNW